MPAFTKIPRPKRLVSKLTKRRINKRLFHRSRPEKIESLLDNMAASVAEWVAQQRQEAPWVPKYQRVEAGEGLPRPGISPAGDARPGLPLDWATDDEEDAVQRQANRSEDSSHVTRGVGRSDNNSHGLSPPAVHHWDPLDLSMQIQHWYAGVQNVTSAKKSYVQRVCNPQQYGLSLGIYPPAARGGAAHDWHASFTERKRLRFSLTDSAGGAGEGATTSVCQTQQNSVSADSMDPVMSPVSGEKCSRNADASIGSIAGNQSVVAGRPSQQTHVAELRGEAMEESPLALSTPNDRPGINPLSSEQTPSISQTTASNDFPTGETTRSVATSVSHEGPAGETTCSIDTSYPNSVSHEVQAGETTRFSNASANALTTRIQQYQTAEGQFQRNPFPHYSTSNAPYPYLPAVGGLYSIYPHYPHYYYYPSLPTTYAAYTTEHQMWMHHQQQHYSHHHPTSSAIPHHHRHDNGLQAATIATRPEPQRSGSTQRAHPGLRVLGLRQPLHPAFAPRGEMVSDGAGRSEGSGPALQSRNSGQAHSFWSDVLLREQLAARLLEERLGAQHILANQLPTTRADGANHEGRVNSEARGSHPGMPVDHFHHGLQQHRAGMQLQQPPELAFPSVYTATASGSQ